MPTLRIVNSSVLSAVGREFELSSAPSTIGRESGNEIVIEDDSMSRRHAQVIQTADGFMMVDTQSANGMWLNGERVQQVVLGPGVQVRVGNTIFELEEGNSKPTIMMAPLNAQPGLAMEPNPGTAATVPSMPQAPGPRPQTQPQSQLESQLPAAARPRFQPPGQAQPPAQPSFQPPAPAPAPPQFQPPGQPQFQAPAQPQLQAPAQPQFQSPPAPAAQPSFQPAPPAAAPAPFQPAARPMRPSGMDALDDMDSMDDDDMDGMDDMDDAGDEDLFVVRKRSALPTVLASVAGLGILAGVGWVFMRGDLLAAETPPEPANPAEAEQPTPADPLSFAIPELGGSITVDPPTSAGDSSGIKVSLGAPDQTPFSQLMAPNPQVAQGLEARVQEMSQGGTASLHPLWGMPLLAGAPKERVWPGPVVLEPSGMKFGEPVTVNVPVPSPPAHLSTATLLVMHRSGEQWEVVTGATYDPAKKTIHAPVQHFSELVAWAVDPSKYPVEQVPGQWSAAMAARHGKLPKDMAGRFAKAMVCEGVQWKPPKKDVPSLAAGLEHLAYGTKALDGKGQAKLSAWLRGLGAKRRKDKKAPRTTPERLFAKAARKNGGDLLASLVAAHTVLRDGSDNSALQAAMLPILGGKDDTAATARLFGAAAYGYLRRHHRGENLGSDDWKTILSAKIEGKKSIASGGFTPDAEAFAVDKLGLEIGEELYDQVHGHSRREVVKHYAIDCPSFERQEKAAASASSPAPAQTGDRPATKSPAQPADESADPPAAKPTDAEPSPAPPPAAEGSTPAPAAETPPAAPPTGGGPSGIPEPPAPLPPKE